jgi:anti-anti-sigma regulatory factor
MLTIKKEQKDKTLTVTMEGSFDESVDLFKEIGEVNAAFLNVDCQGIKRQNSTGVKNWVKFFQSVSATGTVIKFYNCSTAIIDQFNLVSNFGGGGSVESFYVPYSCKKCEAEMVALFKTEDVIKLKYQIPEGKCRRCTYPAAFDDVVEEYFAFLIKK